MQHDFREQEKNKDAVSRRRAISDNQYREKERSTDLTSERMQHDFRVHEKNKDAIARKRARYDVENRKKQKSKKTVL